MIMDEYAGLWNAAVNDSWGYGSVSGMWASIVYYKTQVFYVSLSFSSVFAPCQVLTPFITERRTQTTPFYADENNCVMLITRAN